MKVFYLSDIVFDLNRAFGMEPIINGYFMVLAAGVRIAMSWRRFLTSVRRHPAQLVILEKLEA